MLIMAAGRGTRMRSKLPKVLHPLCGRPMLLWTVHAAREAGAPRIVVVLGEEAEQVRAALPPDVEVAIQDPPAGTGDAVAQARDALEGFEHVIVLSGDHPLLDGSFITALAERHVSSGAAATVTTRELDDPGQYGRVVRAPDGSIERIVETKNPGDATPGGDRDQGDQRRHLRVRGGAAVRRARGRARGQLPGRVLPRRRAAAAARGRPRGRRAPDRGRGRRPRRQHARRPGRGRGGRPRAPARAAHAGGRHDRGSRLDR